MNYKDDKAAQRVWIVNESDPWPDQYIAIISGDRETVKEISEKECKVCYQLDEAIQHARALQVRFDVKKTRIFYPNKVSIIINSTKEREL